MLNEHGERIPLTIADFDREQGHHHAGHPGGGQDHQANAAGVPGRHHAARHGRPDGHSQPHHPGQEGGVRGRRAWAWRPIFPQARGFKESGRLRDRGARVPHQGPGVLGRQVPDVLRRAHPVHRRRLGGHQGPGHRRHQGRAGRAPRHRRSRRHRPAGDDEGLRRGDAAAQDQDHGERQPDHGGRHRDVRRLPREGRRPGEVRLRRRAGLRRPPGRFRRPDDAPAALHHRGTGGARSAGRKAAA